MRQYFNKEEVSFPAGVNIPDSHIQVLEECYRVFDQIVPEPEASEAFRDIFTADGVWKTPFATYTGHDELARSGTLWTGLRQRKSMDHWIYKLYASDDKGEDMMMFGRIRVEDLDAQVRDVAFGCRVVIVSEDRPRVKFFQGWSSAQ